MTGGMMTTYVYGSPHGFNFYEGDAALDYYFKAFYISSRHGRRLMVNRRDDGTTIYSFLCYGLVENTKRPNAFFGMSIVSDGGEYSSDLKELFEWFDYLFGKLVERSSVFRVLDDGKLQYRIDTFKDAENDIEWLKGNLPNIFTKASGVVTLPYDRSYSWGNIDRIICCNIDTAPDRIVADFKRSQWVAVSPDFAPEEEREEINFAGLEDRLNRYNQSLLTVAVNPSPAYLSQLSAAEADCTGTLTLLRKAIKATGDGDEREQCRNLCDKYVKLYDNIVALNRKLRAPKISAYGQKNDSIKTTHDQSGSVRGNSAYNKECHRCYESKPKTAFTMQPDVCDDCLNDGRGNGSVWENIFSPLYLGTSIISVIIIISIWAVIKSCSSSDSSQSREMSYPNTNVEVVEIVFDMGKLETMLAKGQFSEAMSYIKETQAEDKGYPLVKREIDASINRIFEQAPTESIEEKCMEFTTIHYSVLTELGFDIKDINQLAKDYQWLCEVCSKAEITPEERMRARGIIERLPLESQEAWNTRLSYIQDMQPKSEIPSNNRESAKVDKSKNKSKKDNENKNANKGKGAKKRKGFRAAEKKKK